ncbi:hypothetical protein SS50377_22175 [Spironucleus salmonicida]|uniref:Uncharacterized protein n=1 Tax=Spironucleus salmonicida TaxID=348837 RepID=V6LY11_9EUKA|nr:hypothetical protein SS50377_22175 [Spironucleus salmonicida]|eukprot:EST45664.1 Hypothetical protein SS50377_14236 [Spironucleus salmonicida]
MRPSYSRPVPDLSSNPRMYSIMHDPNFDSICEIKIDDFVEQQQVLKSIFRLSNLQFEQSKVNPRSTYSQNDYFNSKAIILQRKNCQKQLNPNITLSPQRTALRCLEKQKQQTKQLTFNINTVQQQFNFINLGLRGDVPRPTSQFVPIRVKSQRIPRKGSMIDLNIRFQ